MMEMALACSSLTGQELIEQFAIEKGSDVVTERQVRELSFRIELYIETLRHLWTGSSEGEESSRGTMELLLVKMYDHLKVIQSLSETMQQSTGGEAGSGA
jgi:hypothetical protein